ncbi:MAG: exodeoxyribonuclease VII small subunit [Wenzhouxiangellaceae bacterium]
MNNTADQNNTDGPSDEPGFEQKLAELEAIVEGLESGQLELAESLKRFERGVELARECRAMLDQAQQVIEQLSDDASAPPPA